MVKDTTFCKHCLEDTCICENYIHCTECGRDKCDGVHSIRNQQKIEDKRIEDLVKILLTNNDILDKVLERLNEIRT
jgi:hypothetical protein